MTLGPVMIDLEGTVLSAEEKELLAHPLVGGLIFFTRNFESPQQIAALVKAVREVRPEILICVDHEGGRVQRFRQGFTHIPAMRLLGERYDVDQADALRMATELGWLMAVELRNIDIDFSFAPVLDLDYQRCDVIGNRAFHAEREKVHVLARAFIQGMKQAGMASCGKHFPGHGYVNEDSHLELPVDARDEESIWQNDVYPFAQLNSDGLLDSVMPAHVIYKQVDEQPAGFSSKWIQDRLRQRMQFDGVVFSDDLNMAAAHVAGGFVDRAQAAMQAGCDMVLVCNNRAGAVEVLEGFQWPENADSVRRLQRMQGQAHKQLDLAKESRWQQAVKLVEQLTQ